MFHRMNTELLGGIFQCLYNNYFRANSNRKHILYGLSQVIGWMQILMEITCTAHNMFKSNDVLYSNTCTRPVGIENENENGFLFVFSNGWNSITWHHKWKINIKRVSDHVKCYDRKEFLFHSSPIMIIKFFFWWLLLWWIRCSHSTDNMKCRLNWCFNLMWIRSLGLSIIKVVRILCFLWVTISKKWTYVGQDQRKFGTFPRGCVHVHVQIIFLCSYAVFFSRSI